MACAKKSKNWHMRMKMIRICSKRIARAYKNRQSGKRQRCYIYNIPCSPDCKIVGQILVDHALSYALTATADVSVVYLQQFWKTVKQVPNANRSIHFMIDRNEITYTVDMFSATIVGYQRDVNKVSAFFMKYLAQPLQTMFKVFNRCLTSRTSEHDQKKINIL
ncbi:hypothetical protein Tco_1510815 [Tanacetum coccineum]